MHNYQVNSIDFKKFLSRFFDSCFEISDDIVTVFEKFLFKNISHPNTVENSELENTLSYLKNVMTRNNLKTLDDLLHYYDKKRGKVIEIFDKLEHTNPEECFALSFQQACTMYMKRIDEEHNFKNNCLYYLQGSAGSGILEYGSIDITSLKSPKLPVCISAEDLKKFVTNVNGMSIKIRQSDCCVKNERMKEMLSN